MTNFSGSWAKVNETEYEKLVLLVISFWYVGCKYRGYLLPYVVVPWRRHQMGTLSALLAFCAGNSPATGDFPSQRPVTRSFDVFFDLCLNEGLSKQSRCRPFETPSRQLWRHSNIPIITSNFEVTFENLRNVYLVDYCNLTSKIMNRI